jgi:hypothetical protein
MIVNHFHVTYNIKWKQAWKSNAFRVKLIGGSILLLTILALYPHFFAFIQKRNGPVLDDWLLASLPSIDVSTLVLALILITTVLGLFRTLQSPYLFLVLLWGYNLMSISRVVTITLVPIDPPMGLTPMTDPLAFPFYGQGGNITKDLFYSGHTGTIFLLYLVLQKKWEKRIALVSTFCIGILLLLQHIHYTIDVVSAPFFVYCFYLLAKEISAYGTKTLPGHADNHSSL